MPQPLNPNSPLDLAYTFKVFRATTRFKKYSLGSTNLMRKKYAKRRHRNNWLNLSYVTKTWVLFFLKNKQFTRFYQSLGLFNLSSYSTTVLFFGRQYLSMSNLNGATVASCSKKVIDHYLCNSGTNFYRTPLLGAPSTVLTTRTHEDLLNSSEVNSGLLQYDNLLYPYNNDRFSENNLTLAYKNLLGLSHTYVIKYSVFVYKIMLYLTMVSLNSFN